MNQQKNQIISDAFDKAALSMQMMMGSEVDVIAVDCSFEKVNEVVQYSSKREEGAHVLRTDVNGSFSSMCYLVLSQTDVKKILENCLPEEVMVKDNAKNRGLQGGFLLELDNIVSAGAITIFSDLLDIIIYGDVPVLSVMNKNNINNYIKNEISNKGFNNCIRGTYQVKKLNIELEFIWMFDDVFFGLITEYEKLIS